VADRLVTLADVGTSAAAALGLPGCSDRIGLGSARAVVVCLIDGLGWQSLQDHTTSAPFLASMAGRSIAAAFPTTTPVGLASLGTGLLAGAHGLVGAAFELPETGEVLAPLQWGHRPNALAVQPDPTLFERMASHGIRVSTLSPSAYEQSGLTRAVLRGGAYEAVEDIGSRVERVRALTADPARSFTYVYWGELDRVGHEHGVDSAAWRDALSRVDRLVERLSEALAPGTCMVVTADHGMVDSPPHARFDLDAEPLLRAGVRRWAGEPRMRHVYTDEPEWVAAAWRDVLGARADVLTRDEMVDRGLMGPLSPDHVDRVGNVLAIARDHWILASRVDALVSGLRGQHGGLTPQEVLIPALVERTAD